MPRLSSNSLSDKERELKRTQRNHQEKEAPRWGCGRLKGLISENRPQSTAGLITSLEKRKRHVWGEGNLNVSRGRACLKERACVLVKVLGMHGRDTHTRRGLSTMCLPRAQGKGKQALRAQQEPPSTVDTKWAPA